MQRLRDTFRRRQNTIEQPVSENNTPTKNNTPSSANSSNGQSKDFHSSYDNLFKYPTKTNHTILQTSSANSSPLNFKKLTSTQKTKNKILKHQAHSLPQSPPVNNTNSKHPPFVYHESHTEPKFFNESFDFCSKPCSKHNEEDKKSYKRFPSNNKNFYSKNKEISFQNAHHQVFHKKSQLSNQTPTRYQHLKYKKLCSSQNALPCYSSLKKESKFRSASFEEISFESQKINYKLSAKENINFNSSETHLNKKLNYSDSNILSRAKQCLSLDNEATNSFDSHLNQSINPVSETCSSKNFQTVSSNFVTNPTIHSLLSSKSIRSKSFDFYRTNSHLVTLHQQKSLQGVLRTDSSNNTRFIHSSNSIRCTSPQLISSILNTSTTSVNSIASDFSNKKKGIFLEIPKWKMLIRRTTTSQLMNKKSLDGLTNELSPTNSSSLTEIDKLMISFEKECVHCALIGEIRRYKSSKGTSTLTSLSSVDDLDNDFSYNCQQDSNNHVLVHKNESNNYSSDENSNFLSNTKKNDFLNNQLLKLEYDQITKNVIFEKINLNSNASTFTQNTTKDSPKQKDSFKFNQEEDCFSYLNSGNDCNKNQQNINLISSNQTQPNQQCNEKNKKLSFSGLKNNSDDFSKSMSLNENSFCEDSIDLTSNSDSRNASLISLPMVTLSLPNCDNQIDFTESTQNNQTNLCEQISEQNICDNAQLHNQTNLSVINSKTYLKKENSLEINQANSSCITVVSLEVPVLVNKSGRSASVDSAYLKVPQRTDIGNREASPNRNGQRSKSIDIALPIGPDGPYIIVPSITNKPQQLVTQ